MPFEAFMDAFIEHDQNTALFDVFLLGDPNQNHLLIRNLATSGALDAIATTNFDLLIERMFATEPPVPLQIVLEETYQAAPHDSSAVTLIKLHGTVSNKETIRSTIRSIASGDAFVARTALVKRLLHSQSRVLWVWGYSCSDTLDINPAIAESWQEDKTVVLLSHDSTITDLAHIESQSLAALPEDHPFRKFRGYNVRAHSDVVVTAILGATHAAPEPVNEHEWHIVVDKWINSLAYPHIAHSILCHLFYNLAEFDLALKYNARAIDANAGRDRRGAGAALSNRGMILFRIGRSLEALEAFRGALATFEGIGFRFGVATSHNNIGYVSAHLGRLQEGYKHLQLGLQEVANGGFREARLCEGYLVKSRGELSALEGKFASADECYDMALTIFRDGYVAEQAEVMMLKGKLRRSAGNQSEGDNMLRDALALASKVGNVDVIAECTRLLHMQ